MQLRTRHQVAFELWCIHENYCLANRSPEGVAALLDRLRERHPYLSEPLIEEGLELFTENRFLELEQRLWGRRRLLLAHSRGRHHEYRQRTA